MDQPKRKRGRPRKTDVVSKTTGNRGKVGRPKGDASIINEYKARMLASPKSNKVLDSIFNAALNDDHKNQAAAWKLVMDRMLPLSYFEKDSTGGRQSVSITISGVGQVATSVSGTSEEEATTEQEENTIEGEFTEESG
tara:strand:+ start:271 stop:684 length:414 start_codon:yes stop_codon:yes gene_type:complete